MSWVYLLLAGLTEIGWPVGLKMAQSGGSKVLGIAMAIGFMAVSGTLLWLVTAGALITDTWRLNPVEGTGERVPLYPVKGEAETKFMWFSSDVDASAGN